MHLIIITLLNLLERCLDLVLRGFAARRASRRAAVGDAETPGVEHGLVEAKIAVRQRQLPLKLLAEICGLKAPTAMSFSIATVSTSRFACGGGDPVWSEQTFHSWEGVLAPSIWPVTSDLLGL